MTMERVGNAALIAALLSAFTLPAAGGVTGSRHNFSGKSFAPGGACSACHREHYAPETMGLWSRDLSQENGYFDQVSDPDYVPGGTLLCYDCHVDYITGSSGASPDNDPPDSSWNAGEDPQDIAFSDGPENPPATSDTGYYELIDGTVPRSGTNDPPTPPLFAPVLDATGGHYWKGVNGDTPTGGYNLGDKLDCSICHDPHDEETGVGINRNEVMLRVNATDGTDTIYIGEALNSSSASRNGTGTGREMCAGCHQYSEDAVPETLFGVGIPIPPVKPFDGHSNADSNECTLCHPHNSLDCGGCHGNPPPLEAAGYNPGGINEFLGPHPRHGNEQSHPTAPGYEFDCTLCHFTFPADHRNGNYQNVVFDAGKNPDPSRSYAAGRICGNLYCHSRGTGITDTVNNSGGNTITWTDAGWNSNDLGCEACHGEDTAGGGPRPMGVTVQYGAPGYPNGSPKANSHEKHLYECRVCHYNVIRDSSFADGWTIFDELLHVSNDTATFTYNVDPDTGTPMFTSYTYNAVGGSCTAIVCHSGSDAQWGDTLTCSSCHGNPPTVGDGFTYGTNSAGVHDVHMNVTADYGCDACHSGATHDSASDFTNAARENIADDFVEVVFDAADNPNGIYTGDPAIDVQEKTCTNLTCHNPDDPTDGITGKTDDDTTNNVVIWADTPTEITACTNCHDESPATNPDGGNHYVHDNSSRYGLSCSYCHDDVLIASGNYTSSRASHADLSVTTSGVVGIGGTLGAQTLSGLYSDPTTAGDGTCSSVYCHNELLTPVWTAAATGACTFCHTSGGAGNNPVSGLHDNSTAPTVSGVSHDDSFAASGTCTSCHTTLSSQSTHVNGTFQGGNGETTAMGIFASYTQIADDQGTCSGVGVGSAGCHDGAGDAGSWARKWDAVVSYAADGATECGGCHGTFAAGWNWDDPPGNASTVDHTNPYAGNDPTDAMGAAGQHPDCEICHGWGDVANYNRDWLGGSDINYVGHGDGHITMNGPDQDIAPFTTAGAEYDDDTGGCAAACHLPAYVMNSNSGWNANYGDFGSGTCETCHDSDGSGPNVMGDGSNATGAGGTPKPYDDGDWGFNVNGHGANGTATNTPAGLNPNAECTDCHDVSDPPGTHNDGTLDSHSTGSINANTYHLNAAFIYSGAPGNEYDVQVAFDTACVNECHAGAGVKYMDHDSESDDNVPDPPGAVEFGLHLTYPDGDTQLHTHGYLGSPWPADSDVRDWTGRTAEPDHAICVSCHDPHGTTIDPAGETENTNMMLRETWKSNNNLCLVCHW